MRSILVVEDDRSVRHVVATALAREGHSVCEVADGNKAIALLDGIGFDLVLTDVFMPNGHGFDVLAKLKRQGNPARVVAMTGGCAESAPILSTIQKLGAERVLKKPFTVAELVSEIRDVLAS
jgi:CheY-like chemotaxis protein